MALVQRIANRSKDYLLFNALLEKFWLGRARGNVTALLYHQVDSPERSSFLSRGGSPVITPKAFRTELLFLLNRGARFFTFEQLVSGNFPKPDEFGVAVCFDDCFLNNYTQGLAVLEEVGVKATFFQSTAMVDARQLIWEHRLYWHTRDDERGIAFKHIAEKAIPQDSRVGALSARRLVEYLRESVPFEICARVLEVADVQLASPGEIERVVQQIYPTATHLRSAKSLGHEIGSHGHHHYKRTNISSAVFEQELEQSSVVLQAILGERPVSFSYPFDSHLPTDVEVCRRHFRGAATVARRRIERDANPMWLPRFTWPGPAKNGLRLRRWLLTGTI